MSDVTPLTLPPKHPQMTITNFNYEGSYLPGLICNIVVKSDLGRSASRSTPQMHHGIYIYYGMYLAAMLDSYRKGGNFLLFLNNYGSKQSVSIVQLCQM